jgi:hypothetical protein
MSLADIVKLLAGHIRSVKGSSFSCLSCDNMKCAATIEPLSFPRSLLKYAQNRVPHGKQTRFPIVVSKKIPLRNAFIGLCGFCAFGPVIDELLSGAV